MPAARPPALFDSGVRVVDLMLTTSCNFRCAYCYQQRSSPRTMTAEVLDAAIRQLVSSRFDRPRLTLYGGEPLLAAALVRRALERVRRWAPSGMNPDVQIVTNGSRLDDRMISLLVRRNVSITLSFDGIAEAQDARSPGSFGVLDQLLVRLRRNHLKYFRDRVTVKMTLTSRNGPFLGASFRHFLSRGVRHVDIYPVIPDDADWNVRSRRELDRQLAAVVELSIEEFRRSGEIPFRAFRGMPASRQSARGGPPCACASKSLLFVDVDGAVAPCSALAPSTLGPQPRAIRQFAERLGGIRVTDPDLSAALVEREKRARQSRLLACPERRRGPSGPCAACEALPTCFVCPISVSGGCVTALHCDVNQLFSRHRAAFHRGLRTQESERPPARSTNVSMSGGE